MPFKEEFIDKLSTLMTAAIGLVAALAWNGFMTEFFNQTFGEQSTLQARFVYAFVVTAIAVVLIIWISSLAAKAKERDLFPDEKIAARLKKNKKASKKK